MLKTNNGKYKLYEVAHEIGLSPKHLSRIFRENNGKSFTQLRIEIKMEYAKHLLKNTNLTIDQITYELGYSHWSSFTRMFKKKNGGSPTSYRKTNKMVAT
ncbi:MAG: AraC family transcriptional regulator [bacterium]